jgi:hypothetical protein
VERMFVLLQRRDAAKPDPSAPTLAPSREAAEPAEPIAAAAAAAAPTKAAGTKKERRMAKRAAAEECAGESLAVSVGGVELDAADVAGSMDKLVAAFVDDVPWAQCVHWWCKFTGTVSWPQTAHRVFM